MTDTPTSHRCDITRPRPRGDFVAVVDASAFDTDDGNDASGPWVTMWRGWDALTPGADADALTARVRYGARIGAAVAAYPDADRAARVVAHVRTARDRWPRGYRTDARPGAIPMVVATIADGTARNVRDGAAIRRTFGNVPASRRVANAPGIMRNAARKFHTASPFDTDDADAPDA